MPQALTVILIAHDGCKDSLVEWAKFNRGTLARCELVGTRSTGLAVQIATGLPVRLLLSGPLGGDAQAGALIATGDADLVVFFWDPLASQPHDVDVKALIRVAVLHDVPIACNRTSADLLISSPLWRRYRTYRSQRTEPPGALARAGAGMREVQGGF